MAAVPKHRISKSSRRERRGHLKLEKLTLAICDNCKKKIEPHTVCQFCGHYKGEEIIK